MTVTASTGESVPEAAGQATLPYELVDVFTDRPYSGNPVSVVQGSDALTAEQMQAVAGELHHGETIFLLPPRRADTDFRVRIFTSSMEVPFAGHPLIGAAWVMARDRGLRASRMVLECVAGPRVLHVADGGAVTLSAGPPQITGPVPAGPLLGAVGLTEGDWTGEPVMVCSTGLAFAFLLVRADAVDRAVPDDQQVRALTRYGITTGLSVVAFDAESGIGDARVFAAPVGVTEDPVTGASTLALGAFLVGAGLLPADGINSFQVRQGRHCGRPTILSGGVHAVAGQVLRTWVVGDVAWAARGVLAVPPAV